jgi:multiple sugar transport system substrate-binding protein
VINGPEAVKALSLLQGWARSGWINPATRDDSDFIQGRSALSYVGHWVQADYRKALGDDLVLIPMPKFGARAVTGAGSWNFGISADCKAPREAASVLAHLMSPEEIGRVTQANGAIPGTRTALARNRNYSAGGPLAIYAEQIQQGVAQVRPATPAYPVITTAFSEALNNVLAGSEPKKELDRAARRIDQAIKDNKGYPALR